ncbi:MAG: bifunctional methionine sulfoxide reductase B/A protein [Dysgonamonadaceae bacterium]|nr:bifunctional methionine sulfoxide reductase B/A protein [Dysgonamonadaceae bacterium]MDD4729383.1 bifunctional methionine sulfoxide reductase B/A protein [Dysgonamonadaceae bacterium]
MKKIFLYVILLTNIMGACAQNNNNKKDNTMMKFNKLTQAEENVIVHKGTEHPFSGKYVNNEEEGTYVCKRCDAPLYYSSDKFDARCGWPSFDDEIEGAVKRVLDADGRRTEIICNNCGAHLGHVFLGEQFTNKNTRHCVNSISLKFIPKKDESLERAYFASGCFWGTEYFFMQAPGVVETSVGYMGGDKKNPTYKEVSTGSTGHLEATEVVYDSSKTTYGDMVRLFFETHDFTQTNGQGPDIGSQYLSAIFYNNKEEKAIAEKYINLLTDKGYRVATMLKPAVKFWKAEDYHQQYYKHKGSTPYCHIYRKIF